MPSTMKIFTKLVLVAVSICCCSVSFAQDDPLENAYRAIRAGNFTELKELLDAGLDVNSTHRSHRSLLQLSVESYKPSMVQLLIDRKANTNHGGVPNRYPLTSAVDNAVIHSSSEFGFESMRIVSQLLNSGADPNVVSEYGYTPLMYATKHPRSNHLKSSEVLVRMLLRRGADPMARIGIDMRPELYRVEQQAKKISSLEYAEIHKVANVAALLREHVALKQKGVTWPKVSQSEEALSELGISSTELVNKIKSGGFGFFERMKAKRELSKLGVSLESRALVDAAVDGDAALVGLMLGVGVDGSTKDYSEACAFDTFACDALEWSVVAGHSDAARLLTYDRLAKRSGSNRLGDGLNKVLAIAASTGSVDIARLALDGGADPNEETPYVPLYLAVSRGHTSVVQLLLRRGADARLVSPKMSAVGRTLLMDAAFRGYTEITGLLIEKHGNVNARADNGDAALPIAIAENKIGTARLLIEKGADINAPGANDLAPIQIAVLNDSPRVVALLKSKGARTDLNLELMAALYAGDSRQVASLLDRGADPNFSIQGKVGYYQKESPPPLLIAVRSKDELSADALITKGADTNTADRQGVTPLMEAARLNQADLVKGLLARGAEANVPIQSREEAYVASALHYAANNGSLEIVKLLLSAGADINAQAHVPAEGAGGTPLLLAVANEHAPVAKFLIDSKADVNLTDYTGTGPLTIAIRKGNQELIKMLTAAGAEDRAKAHW